MHATEQEEPEVIEARKNYKVWLWSVLAEKLVFIDETGMRLNMTRSHARAYKGIRAKGAQPKKKGKHVTMIGAMALSGVLTSVLLDGGTNTQVFLSFVEQCLLPVLWEGAIVVMDNLNVHKQAAVRALIELVKATVIFLPTYSPAILRTNWGRDGAVVTKFVEIRV